MTLTSPLLFAWPFTPGEVDPVIISIFQVSVQPQEGGNPCPRSPRKLLVEKAVFLQSLYFALISAVNPSAGALKSFTDSGDWKGWHLCEPFLAVPLSWAPQHMTVQKCTHGDPWSTLPTCTFTLASVRNAACSLWLPVLKDRRKEIFGHTSD